MSTTDQRLRESEVFDILRNDRRRSVIEYLQVSDGSGTVGDLADAIASVEAASTPPPRNVRQSVYVSLHQTHLPRLDHAGIVTFDPDTNEVRLLDTATEVTSYMEAVSTDEPVKSHPVLLFALSLTGLLLVAASSLGTPLLSLLSASTWAILVFVAIGVTAGVDAFASRHIDDAGN